MLFLFDFIILHFCKYLKEKYVLEKVDANTVLIINSLVKYIYYKKQEFIIADQLVKIVQVTI